jgi:hypothetical protein
MFTALLSFLGGSVFRLMMGEIVQWLKQGQEQRHEVELMRVQAELAAGEHARQLEAIRVQSELGVKTIAVQAEGDVAVAEAMAFRDATAAAQKPTGIMWVDAWNAAVRPAFATVALGLWALALWRQDWVLNEWDTSMMAVIVGFFFADRSLRKQGR